MASKSTTNVQADGMLACLLHLQTLLARLSFWINLPFCWLVIILTLTGHAESQRSRAPVEIQYWISIAAGIFGGWLLLSHTVGVFIPMSWELWWNPYAYHPKLRGKVTAKEEESMLMSNREIAKRVVGDIFEYGRGRPGVKRWPIRGAAC